MLEKTEHSRCAIPMFKNMSKMWKVSLAANDMILLKRQGTSFIILIW